MEDLDDEDEMAWEMAQANRANPTIDAGPSQSSKVRMSGISTYSQYGSDVQFQSSIHSVVPAIQGRADPRIETVTYRDFRLSSAAGLWCVPQIVEGYAPKSDRVGGSRAPSLRHPRS